jgi:hypothetical protein
MAAGSPANFSALLRRQRSFDHPKARMDAKLEEYQTYASVIAMGGPLTPPERAQAWERVKWVIDILVHVIEDQNAGNIGFKVDAQTKSLTASIVNTIQTKSRNGSQFVYQEYTRILHEHLTQTVLASIRAKSGHAKLVEFALRWENHKIMSEVMRVFFLEVDSSFITGLPSPPHKRSLPSLSAVALIEFKSVLVDAAALADLQQTMLGIIAEHRRKGAMDDDGSTLLKATAEIFYTLGLTVSFSF